MNIIQTLINFITGFIDMIRKLVAEIRSRNDER